LIDKGLSERRSLPIVYMSAGTYRYEPAQDRNCAPKEKIINQSKFYAAPPVGQF